MNILCVYSLVFKVSIFVGFLYHAYTLTSEYFAYKTTSSFEINQNHEVNLFGSSIIPKLAVCIRFTDIIDMKKFAAKYKPVPSSLGTTGTKFIRYIQTKVTVNDIFEMTPKEDEAISLCYYRNTDGLKYMKYEDVTKCLNIFHVSRFFTVESMCYAFTPRESRIFPMAIVDITINSPSYMYGLGMTLAGANRTRFMIYYGEYPFTSRLYSMSASLREEGEVVDGLIFRFYWVANQLLPPPYDTMCIWNTSECLTHCFRPIETQLGHVFGSNIITVPDPRPQFSFIDSKNVTVRRIVSETEKRCLGRCTEKGCKMSYTVTTADAIWLKEKDSAKDVFYVHLKTPQQPGVRVTAFARLDMTSFLLYLLNCLNFWYGIDFLFVLRFSEDRYDNRHKAAPPPKTPRENIRLRRLTPAERREQLEGLHLPWYCAVNSTTKV